MNENELRIDRKKVHETLTDCLYQKEEIEKTSNGKETIPDEMIYVKGIANNFWFNPEKLKNHMEEIINWLRALPKKFRENSEKGGESFSAAATQDDCLVWTDCHDDVEELFCLGMALGLVKCLTPRCIWKTLPNGLPYYEILITEN